VGQVSEEINNQSPRRYFINQLYELLTEFGPVHDICFDGANYATSASTDL
jgi:alpha-L-fucosidase